MTDTFTAMVIDAVDGKPKSGFREISLADLPDHDVLVEVAYSTVNYKDGSGDFRQGPHRAPHSNGWRY